MRIDMGKVIGIIGTVLGLAGTIMSTVAQQKTMKETITKEVSEALKNQMNGS